MSVEAAARVAILIPSLEPDDRLPAYIRSLAESGFRRIVVVDDGSGEASRPVFARVEAEGAAVLRHEVNRGKGVALKTGYRYIQEQMPEVSGVITADSDGQHTVADCLRLAEELEKGGKALYLGSRDFDQADVPAKSRKGNKITSAVFRALYGQYLPDTQTGLRAFPREYLEFMIGVEGERYEYEMKVLIACSRAGIPMIPVPITTIYENNNEGSHFHPVRDSWRIYKVILGSFFRFMASSLVCVALDQGIFNLLNLAVFANGAKKEAGLILASTVIARVVSGGVNFSLNRHLVFGQRGKVGGTLGRYIAVSVAVMLASAGGTWLVSRVMNSTVAKMIVDTLLYFVSYTAQQRWVFREGAGK